MHFGSAELVKLHGSTRSSRRAGLLDTSNVSCQDVDEPSGILAYALLISERLYIFRPVLTLVAFREHFCSIFWNYFAWCCG